MKIFALYLILPRNALVVVGVIDFIEFINQLLSSFYLVDDTSVFNAKTQSKSQNITLVTVAHFA